MGNTALYWRILMNVTAIADYLRLSDDSEAALLEEITLSAELFLQRVTGKTQVFVDGEAKPIADDLIYQQALKRLAAHWFENRSAESETAQHKLAFSLQHLINFITLSSEYI